MEGESVNDLAFRLGELATHCKFEAYLEKELERQFIVGVRMDEVERKCCSTDKVTLKQAIEWATSFERLNMSVNGLNKPTAGELGVFAA